MRSGLKKGEELKIVVFFWIVMTLRLFLYLYLYPQKKVFFWIHLINCFVILRILWILLKNILLYLNLNVILKKYFLIYTIVN